MTDWIFSLETHLRSMNKLFPSVTAHKRTDEQAPVQANEDLRIRQATPLASALHP